MSKLIQISQLNATPDGTYVNGEVRAVLSRAVEPKNPKAPWKATLSDSTGAIEASMWGGSIAHWEGKQIVLSGKGMKVQEYKGTKTLSVGDKVNIAFGGAPGAAAQTGNEGDFGDVSQPSTASAPFGGHNAPLPPRNAPSVARIAQEHLPVNLPHGATVGGALARAVDIWLAINAQSPAWSPEAPQEIEQITRDLVEIQGRIERGEPAKSDVPF